MMLLRSSLLAVLLLTSVAYAQAGNYETAEFPDFGFALALPGGGEIQRPGSEGWDNHEEVAFEWYGPADSPVALIQARVDELGTAITPDTFRLFADALLSNWASAPQPADPDPQPSPYQVLNAADNLQINGRTWNLIEVADRSDEDTPVYYSVFSTYDDSRIYTVTLYYLQPDMETVQAFGRPVLQGFSILSGAAETEAQPDEPSA